MAIEYVDATQLDSDLTSVANAIRTKSGGSSQLAFPAGFVSEIQAIPSGGGGTTDGLVDIVFDIPNYGTGAVENNSLKNYTTYTQNNCVVLFFKKPIHIEENDTFKLTLSNKTATDNFYIDVFFLCDLWQINSGVTPLNKRNLRMQTTSYIESTLTAAGSADVYAFAMSSRSLSQFANFSADINVYVNDVLVF